MSTSTATVAPRLTQVAVGIIHHSSGQILFAQRPAGKPYAGWWEFPGGKIEAKETLALALARELREELDIQILDCHHWLTQRYEYPHAHVNLQFCHVHAFKGSPKSMEGQAFTWGTAFHPPLPFLPAALPVLKAMQLPDILHFTTVNTQGFEQWKARLHTLTTGTIILQEPTLTQAQAHSVLIACLNWKMDSAPHTEHRRVIVASCHPKTWWGLADGVHFLESHLMTLRQRPSYPWVGASASNHETIHAAKRIDCNYVTIPVNDSWGTLGEHLNGVEIASYAQLHSAINPQHSLPLAHAAGAAGIALAPQ